jgi:hypothetical protein
VESGFDKYQSRIYYSNQWTYLYDNTPLAKTLEKYIDYEKLTPPGNENLMYV